jgi:hypothetical protein
MSVGRATQRRKGGREKSGRSFFVVVYPTHLPVKEKMETGL